MKCPRRDENPGPWKLPEEDRWRDNHTCSYCGGLDPEIALRRIEAGNIAEPTSKDYKLYLTDKFKTSADMGRAPDEDSGIGEGERAKVYFQHFDEAQQRRFVQLLNKGRVHTGGFAFHPLPFFVQRVPAVPRKLPTVVVPE